MSNFVNLLNIVYPVGGVYITFSEISPIDTVGGTWELLENTFLYSSANATGITGGEEEHILTVDEMPKHSHYCNFGSSGAAGSAWITKYQQYRLDGGWDTNKIGGSKAYNNMPPYITVHIYRRIA